MVVLPTEEHSHLPIHRLSRSISYLKKNLPGTPYPPLLRCVRLIEAQPTSTMAEISYRDGISIGVLVAYFPVLIIAVFLIFRDGIRHSSSWIFLNLFALARIIGACFQLATVHDPSNICLSIGISPLELTALGLLSRLLDNINNNSQLAGGKRQRTPITSLHMKIIEQ